MFEVTVENWSELFGQYADMVYRIALGILRIPEEAEDIVTECFIAAVKQRTFSDDKHLKYWLIRTAENKALNAAKSARIRRSVPLDKAEELAYPDSGDSRQLLETVLALPDRLKTAVYMFYYEDMPAAEIAQALKISENSVYKRLERARVLLRISAKEGEL